MYPVSKTLCVLRYTSVQQPRLSIKYLLDSHEYNHLLKIELSYKIHDFEEQYSWHYMSQRNTNLTVVFLNATL